MTSAVWFPAGVPLNLRPEGELAHQNPYDFSFARPPTPTRPHKEGGGAQPLTLAST
jgi:hypothetical protein